ncbi:MAG: LPS export ABC transporter periplasmic protein LptC [Limnohabitans sp.]|nr:MAG: LPS export ABC transporter periplasmic protein LptC [Limnohabitans sp.]
MKAWQATRRALDRLTLYLPLLVMVVLAMGSWWLVRSMPDLWSSPAVTPVRKDPDYHLENFSTQVFNAQGRRTSQVSGEKARHYPDTDELHIDMVRFVAVSDDGTEVQATAQRGIATGDGERVTLMGNVHVVREARGASPRLELRGEKVVALQSQEKLLSDVPVEITRERDRFTASTMAFDMKSGQYQLSGRVHGLLQPRER